ncbi:MAG: YbjN domain-containing protein [Marinicaulis sp.]|nr:YbjN domain-containing protein [Marinicaulis sp.]
MNKHLIIKGIIALITFFGGLYGAASAQIEANNQLSTTGVMTKISGSDATSILSEFGITTTLQPYTGDGTGTMIAATSGGAQFFLSFFNCADPATAIECDQMLVYTGLPSSGISYDIINTFNTNSDVSKAVNISNQQIIIFGTQLFLNGGLGRENVQLILALFLNDMQRYVDTQSMTGTAVSMMIGKAPDSKVGNLYESNESSADLLVQRTADTVDAGADFRTENALSAAIANTLASEFASDEVRALIE